MKLFGGYLPFIGFREHPVDSETRRAHRIPKEIKTLTFFELEWFHNGVGIALLPKQGD